MIYLIFYSLVLICTKIAPKYFGAISFFIQVTISDYFKSLATSLAFEVGK